MNGLSIGASRKKLRSVLIAKKQFIPKEKGVTHVRRKNGTARPSNHSGRPIRNVWWMWKTNSRDRQNRRWTRDFRDKRLYPQGQARAVLRPVAGPMRVRGFPAGLPSPGDAGKESRDAGDDIRRDRAVEHST